MQTWELMWSHRGLLAAGFYNTILLFIIITPIAFALGATLAYLIDRHRTARLLIVPYISVLRMLPIILVCYIFYFGLPALGIGVSAWTVGIVAMSLSHSAYIAEILRGARMILPAGSVEAGVAIGMSPVRLYLRIVLPQLLLKNNAVLGNQIIVLLKETSFLSMITIMEMTATANSISSRFLVSIEPFLIIFAGYWLISLLIDYAMTFAGKYAARRGMENA